ncbi:unnamed protein product [Medioppia subpectinata]|uniref:ABC transporter domain-containing protein n=1 Tax=Medioppia subpectinata TaxID=1979941 RepID=A0A7R9KNI0_9ACAR|nr:unnamed protein product [Medioppia subpectinata]CAG2106805.1 unnamed protein product [Medioppia subpectinata]
MTRSHTFMSSRLLNYNNLRKIFALLGPNGAGKTTLIKIILGQLALKCGTIHVYGEWSGFKSSGICGPGVGYMPQTLALFNEFTISEIINYYGLLYRMNCVEINYQLEGLRRLLDLPDLSRLIGVLSGGEQRRVSIAITMLHKPRLVILDEPTVGVDSLLRHRIWQYLEDICNKNGQTVIITTHYIEEARSAHNVAFMRSGAVLRQSNPQQLMDEYECPTLEDVFLQLCHSTENTVALRQDLNKWESNADIDLNNNNILTTNETNIKYNNNAFIDFQRIKAMLIKQWIAIKRRPLFMCAYYTLVIISMASMNIYISNDIKHIPIAIYNGDVDNIDQLSLSNLFINSINDKNMRISHYTSIDSAVQSVTNGDNYLALEFRTNFSDNFESRVVDMFDTSDDVLNNSAIRMYIDLSNPLISIMSIKYLIIALNTFMNDLGQMLNKTNIYQLTTALNVHEVLHGNLVDFMSTFSYVGPGLLLAITFTMPMVLSAFLLDKSVDTMNRVFMTGVTAQEYMVAYMFMNMVAGVVQVLISMAVVFVVYGVQQSGSYWEIFLLLLTEVLSGISIGLMFSLILTDTINVTISMCFFFFPMIIMSGIIWTVEAIPSYFRWLSYASPLTLPVLSINNIMQRGWDLTRPEILTMEFL